MEKIRKNSLVVLFIMLIITKGILIFYQIENNDNDMLLDMIRETINLISMVTLFGIIMSRKK